MSYSVTQIQRETEDFFVLSVAKGYEVYQKGITHSKRVAIFGSVGLKWLDKAIADCERRQKELNERSKK